MTQTVARRTLVAFHAHPDDEALLTAGTMARAAAQGHRVVLVVATDGAAGLASADYRGRGLGEVRRREALVSAAALGVTLPDWRDGLRRCLAEMGELRDGQPLP